MVTYFNDYKSILIRKYKRYLIFVAFMLSNAEFRM